MKIGRFLRASRQDEPLVVTLTGVRLGDRLYFRGSRLDWVVPLAGRTGLSGQFVVIADNATQLKTDAERAGVLVEVTSAPDPGADFDLAVVEATADWTSVLGSLLTAVRQGGRLVILTGGSSTGLLSRLRSQGASPPGDDEIVAAVSAAGWGRARPIDSRQTLRAVEAFRL